MRRPPGATRSRAVARSSAEVPEVEANRDKPIEGDYEACDFDDVPPGLTERRSGRLHGCGLSGRRAGDGQTVLGETSNIWRRAASQRLGYVTPSLVKWILEGGCEGGYEGSQIKAPVGVEPTMEVLQTTALEQNLPGNVGPILFSRSIRSSDLPTRSPPAVNRDRPGVYRARSSNPLTLS